MGSMGFNFYNQNKRLQEEINILKLQLREFMKAVEVDMKFIHKTVSMQHSNGVQYPFVVQKVHSQPASVEEIEELDEDIKEEIKDEAKELDDEIETEMKNETVDKNDFSKVEPELKQLTDDIQFIPAKKNDKLRKLG